MSALCFEWDPKKADANLRKHKVSFEDAQETGIPYQSLINLYLKDCAATQKKLSLAWKAAPAKGAAKGAA